MRAISTFLTVVLSVSSTLVHAIPGEPAFTETLGVARTPKLTTRNVVRGDIPFPLAAMPGRARTYGQVRHLKKQLAKHEGPVHTYYQHGKNGPVMRLQKDGKRFHSWVHTGKPSAEADAKAKYHKESQEVATRKKKKFWESS